MIEEHLKTRIEPSRGLNWLEWRELWKYRELLYFLSWRDVKVRYKQTALGMIWAIIQPLITMIVFTIFFGKFVKVPSEGVPYPIFTYVALLPWTLFTYGLNQASNSLVSNANLVTKVYFPRLVIPISSILSGLLDFMIAFVILLGLMLFYQIQLTRAIIWLPLFLLLALITSLGIGLWLSALNVQYRDIRYALPFLTQLLLLATPIAYPSTLLADPWRTFYGLNPMVGVVEGFRWVLLGINPPGLTITVSAVVSILLLVTGIYYFKYMEEMFADIV